MGKSERGLNFGGVLIAILAISVAVVIESRTTVAQNGDEVAVRDALLRSASSFEKNDMLAATQSWANDESLTVFEQGHANYGWADYRDNHLGPEMREDEEHEIRPR
jgi:hypothetical protein